jgi:tripartite-type tricarboxylate transporter receptor subunit TctC
MNPSLFAKKLPFDPQKDFAAVAQVAILPFILVVNSELPVRNFDGVARAGASQAS